MELLYKVWAKLHHYPIAIWAQSIRDHCYKVGIQVILAHATQNASFKNHPKDILHDENHLINQPSI